MGKRTVVGLDIGSTHIKAVQATHKTTGMVIDKVAKVETPQGAIVDGSVDNPIALQKTLTALWKEAKFSTKDVIVGVGGERVLARSGEFKWYSDENFRKLLELNAKELFPVDLDDYLFDFHTLSEYSKREINPEDQEERITVLKKRVLMVGTEKRVIDGLISTLRGSKLRPVAVEANGLALLRSTQPSVSAEDAADLSVDIGANNITITLHKFGQPMYIRTMSNIGGELITQEVKNEFKIPYAKAERRKLQAFDLSAMAGVERAGEQETFFDLSDEEGEEEIEVDIAPQLIRTQEIISSHMGTIMANIRETVETFLYAQTDNDLTTLSPFVISGGVAASTGLLERISSEFQNSAALATPLTTHKLRKKAVSDEDLESQHEFVIATGLAMEKDNIHA